MTGVKISGYSCFLLKGFPAWGSHARTVSFDASSGASQAVVAQSRKIEKTSAVQAFKSFDDGSKAFYPYISIETDSSGVTRTFEIYHSTEQASQVDALRNVGFALSASSSDSNEFKMLLNKQGGVSSDIEIELIENEISMASNWANGKSIKELNEFAEDNKLVAESHQAHLNTFAPSFIGGAIDGT